MAEQGAFPQPSVPTAPIEISSPSAAKNIMNPVDSCRKSTAEGANFSHESLPVVVLGASPLQIGAFFQ